jgi:hypothetical protein
MKNRENKTKFISRNSSSNHGKGYYPEKHPKINQYKETVVTTV